jgi:hypothetical protein
VVSDVSTIQQRWRDGCFSPIDLRQLGLVVQLNHSSQCPRPRRAHVQFRVLHITGIHDVALDFCDCPKSISEHQQLLRRGLYPSTHTSIKTCATFVLLEYLHLLSLVTKGPTYDFYRFIEKLSVNTGIDVPKSRYRQLIRMLLQWRHLKMLKRGGRGHDPTGIEGTKPGELAVSCLECPYPEINMDKNWEQAPITSRYVVASSNFILVLIVSFLHAPTLCIDANFKLKAQYVSSYSRDPALSRDTAFFQDREPYDAYVLRHADEEDVS